jgi:hypothetical protein
VPTALDNGQRAPRKLLKDLVRESRRRAEAIEAQAKTTKPG